jgi:predicted YcjX-like family ATPase
MEGKWKDNKGVLYLRGIDYYGKQWVDLRIMNMSNTPPNFTRHGVRLTEQQVEELIPILRELVSEMKDEREMNERKESSERNTR